MNQLLTLTKLEKRDIVQILDVASQMRRIVAASYKKGPQLLGSTVAGVWESNGMMPSAFTLATQYLSGSALAMYESGDVTEICKGLANMGVDNLVVSNKSDNLIYSISQSVKCNFINGGSSQSHPIAVLADLMTIMGKLDGLSNLSILAVGNRDVNKIAELNYCLELFGSSMVWYLPKEDFATVKRGIVLDKIDVAFSGADAVIDLGLTEFSESAKYYGTSGGIDEQLLDKARIDAPLLGCRHIVDKVGVKEYNHSAVNTQQSNLVAVAMAVLYLMKA